MRHPSLRFALIGAILFGATRLVGDPAPARPPVDRRTDDEVLLDEALARGWAGSDPVARRRLILDMRFLLGPTPARDETLLAEAFSLGLDRTDPVVRRRLVQRMRLEAASAARAEEPDPAEVRAFAALDPEGFAEPDRWTLDQVYVRPDRAEDLRAIRDALEAGGRPETLGDPFPLGTRFFRRSERELDLRFGGGFARSVAKLDTGRWSGPIRSALGIHVVRVEERIPSGAPDLARARAALMEARERARIRDLAATLREARR